MPFSEILGQSTAIDTLKRALQLGKVHHAYRFEGPDGVGKEKAAFALAQCLVCTEPREKLACGNCSACRRVVTLSEQPPQVPKHPDVVLLERRERQRTDRGARCFEPRARTVARDIGVEVFVVMDDQDVVGGEHHVHLERVDAECDRAFERGERVLRA